MRTAIKPLACSLAAIAFAASAVACGGSNQSNPPASLEIVMNTAPNSLDPALGNSVRSYEATWLVYTGLVTYAHAEAESGTELIAGLAQSLPAVTSHSRTYTFRLRKGLVYSDGTLVEASDVAHAIERSIRLNWNGKRMLTEHIAGAQAFDEGKAASISGIAADDATDTVSFHLTAPYGPFLNVLAFPAAAPVPGDTPVKPLSRKPPPGVGPYEIANVAPNGSYSLVRNPRWATHTIPGIPTANVDIGTQVVHNYTAEVERVLSGSADMLDTPDTLPAALVGRVEREAKGRYLKESYPFDELFFLNVKTRPFDSQLVREAVQYALDRQVLERIDNDMLQPGCFLLPRGIVGSPFGDCPYGNNPNPAKARRLVAKSGLQGSPVTVWSVSSAPYAQFAAYYASVLNAIGLKASVKLLPPGQYAAAVGNPASGVQTGWLSFASEFPSPLDFYQLLDASLGGYGEDRDPGRVDDPRIQRELAALTAVPPSRLPDFEKRWQALDEYVARKAYLVVIGSDDGVKLVSRRTDFQSTVFHRVYGTDWSLLRFLE